MNLIPKGIKRTLVNKLLGTVRSIHPKALAPKQDWAWTGEVTIISSDLYQAITHLPVKIQDDLMKRDSNIDHTIHDLEANGYNVQHLIYWAKNQTKY